MQVDWCSDRVHFADILNRMNNGDIVKLEVDRKGEKLLLQFPVETEKVLAIDVMYPAFEELDYECLGGAVFMELSLNHVHGLLKRAPQHAPILARYARSENQYDPVLVITNVLPNSSAKKAKVLGLGMLLEKINDMPVSTLDQFRQAVAISKGNKFLTIKTKDTNFFAALSVDDIVAQEDRLAAQNFYPKSDLIAALQ